MNENALMSSLLYISPLYYLGQLGEPLDELLDGRVLDTLGRHPHRPHRLPPPLRAQDREDDLHNRGHSTSAANRLIGIGEVVQSRRRPLLGDPISH